MITNNLVMPNFKYNNKIVKSNSPPILDNQNNSNIIIKESNYNIGLSRDNLNI